MEGGTEDEGVRHDPPPNAIASLELDVRPRTNIRTETEEGPERTIRSRKRCTKPEQATASG